MRIEVDPDVLIQAGRRLTTVGSQLGMLSAALSAALGSGIASGMDPAGANFGFKYGRQAQDFANTLAKATDAHDVVGFMLQATGYNYQNADAASTIGGSAITGGVGGQPGKTTAGSAPLGPSDAIVAPPTKWAIIQPLLGFGMSWPSGNPSLLRLTAAQWRNLATGLAAFDADMTALKGVASQQDIPESRKIDQALSDLASGVTALSDTATAVAQSIDDFAGGVQDTQDAIRRLMDRISLDGLWDTVTGFLTGDGDDILRDIAHDIGQLLDNFEDQVKGVVGLLEELTIALGSAADDFQKWIRPILVRTFGDGVGNALADYVTLQTDFSVGAVTGLINTVSGVVSLADVDTWKGMAELAASVAEDPTKLPGVLENMGKQFVAWDKWSGDHPGRAAGEAAFNIGTLFVPGGALSKTGSVAKGLSYTNRLLEEGRFPRFSDLPGLGRGSHDPVGSPDFPALGPTIPDNPHFRPAAIPDSVISPFPPHGVDTPSGPRGLEGPTGPPEPPGSTATPGGGSHHAIDGGDGPPPEPPNRTAGPPETRTEPASDSSTRPASSVDPNTVQSPGFPEQSTPIHDQSPDYRNTAESFGSTHHHDPDRAPSGPDSMPVGHEPTAPEARSHGYATEPGGHGSDAHREQLDERVPTPADDNPVQERTAHAPNQEQASAPGDGDARRQDSVAITPAGATGTGMPMTSHGSGSTHTSTENAGSAARASAPESSTLRNPEPRMPTDSPRLQQPSAAAGPAMGNVPTASVNPASAPSISSSAHEAPRAGPEPPTPRAEIGARENPPPLANSTPQEPRSAPGADRPDPPAPRDANAGTTPGQFTDPAGPVGNPAESRAYGPHELRPVEDPEYQTAVERALRDSQGGYLVHADPRTNDYGALINDGGPMVDGRSNNCLDCSLSALSSFLGDPTVSAPRWADELPSGVPDNRSGEQGGLRRAADWLGGEMLEFHGQSIANQFDALHQYVSDLGPGSAALVHNGWHAVDSTSTRFLYNPDGSPVTDGSHATVVVYPEGASGPVWWDPQTGQTFDRPPPSMLGRSTFLHFTPIEPDQGAHHGAAGNQGTGAGISGGDVANGDVSGSPVPPRVGVHDGPESGADRRRGGTGDGSTGDRFGDRDRVRVPELVDADGGGGVHGVQADGREQGGPSDLSISVAHHDPTDPGERGDDRVPVDSGVSDRSAGTEPGTPIDDPQAHVRDGSHRSAVEQGGVPRRGGEPSESGSLAGSGYDRAVTGTESDQPAGQRWGEHDVHREHEADQYADGGAVDADQRHAQLADGTEHRIWASREHLAALAPRFVAADAWLAERGLTRSDIQPLLVQPADWLNAAQRELVYGFRHQFPDVERGEGVQKIIDTEQADSRLAAAPQRYPPDETGGSVSVARDTRELDTPEKIYGGLGLDYDDTPFAPDRAVVAMRFTVGDDVSILVPDGRLSERVGHGSSLDPPGYEYPFTGTGFTASDVHTVPEYFLPGRTPMNTGAEMYRINPDGSEELMAVLNYNEEWIGVVKNG